MALPLVDENVSRHTSSEKILHFKKPKDAAPELLFTLVMLSLKTFLICLTQTFQQSFKQKKFFLFFLQDIFSSLTKTHLPIAWCPRSYGLVVRRVARNP